MMKRMLFVTLLLVPAIASAQDTGIDAAIARSYFQEVAKLGSSDGGRLWGRAVNGPMLFVDARTRAVVANMADTTGLLREQDGVWIGTLPLDINIANTATDFAGRRWSMVIWPPADNRYERARLLMHESFHRIQDAIGLSTVDVANSHLATADGRIWMRLEWRALAEAVLRTGPARTQALKDALAFRSRRRQGVPGADQQERQLELNEGLAEYTGFVLSGLPRSALYDRVAVQLAQYEHRDNFARSFAYATGPAYGLLLDAVDKTWRKRLDSQSDLAKLAAAAYGITAVAPTRAEERVAAYQGARMIAQERAGEAQRLARQATFRKALVDGPTLSLPIGHDFRYSFNPNGAVPLPEVGTAFDAMRVTDSWGILDVASGGVLLKRNDQGITGVSVPVPATQAPPTKGDGWQLQLASGWTIKPGPRAGDWVVARE